MSLTIEGSEELIRNLQKIDSDLRGSVALEAVQEGAAILQYQGEQNAPVLTSALKNSFRTESRIIGNGAVAEVGPHVVYDRIQEFGGYTGRGHKAKIKGKFYLTRAVEQKRGEIQKVMADTIKDYLK